MFIGACIDTLYTEHPWEQRFAKARADGFDCVEFWDWRSIDLKAAKACADEAGIWISGFNGDADFSLIDPGQRGDYLDTLRQSLEAAKVLGAPSVTIHSNALGEGGIVVNHYDDLPDSVKLCAMYETLRQAADIAEGYGVALHLEALNVYTDHVGNYLKYTKTGARLVRLINSPRLKLLYDVYHMQINEGRLCDTLSEHIDCIGHVHIADAPGRHEPGTGEINYVNVLRHLAHLGYQGAVGCELFPADDTAAAVKAIMEMRRRAL